MGAEGEFDEERFEGAGELQAGGEIECEIAAHNFKAVAEEEVAGFGRSEGDGIAIEGDAAHDETRSRIPRIIFPKAEEAPGTKRFVNELNGFVALGERDVVEDAVAVSEIDLRVAREFLDKREANFRERIQLARDFDGLGRDFDAVDGFDAGEGAEKGNGGARAAAEIEDGFGNEVDGGEALFQEIDAASREVFFFFAGDSETFVDGFVVALRELVELRIKCAHAAHLRLRRPRMLRKKLEKKFCRPRVVSMAPGMTKRMVLL